MSTKRSKKKHEPPGNASGEPRSDEAGERGERKWLVVAFLLALNLFFCLVLFEPKLHTGGDSAQYVTLAGSVLERGDGYADTMAPGEPVPHTKYPPGFPLLLAPLLALLGPNVVALKLLMVSMTVASVLVFLLLARERVGPIVWLPVGLAFAANPVVVDYSRWLLSEAPYLLFTLLALLFLERAGRETGVGKYFWLSLLAMVAAYYMRSIGVVFLVAGTLFYLYKKLWKKAAYFTVVGAALTLPWLIRNQLLGGSATPYIQQFLLKSVYEPEAGYHDLWGMIGRFFTNVWIYSAREMPRVITGSDSSWSASPAMKVLAVVLSGLVLVGLVSTWRKRPGVAELYFALSLLAIFLFEEVVSDVRYLMPLVPLLLLYIGDGIDFVAARLGGTGGQARSTAAAMLLLAGLGVTSQLARVPQNLDMIRQYRAGDRLAGYHPNWRSFFEASDWVAANTPPDAVVTVRKPRLFYLWTGRKVLEYPFTTDPDSVLSVILNGDYVMVDQISGTTGRYLVPAIEKAPDRFRIVYQSEGVPTWILQVLEPQEGAGVPGERPRVERR